MLAIDARRVDEANGSHRTRARGCHWDGLSANAVSSWSVGEICINSIDEDGVRSDYDIPLNQACQAVDVPSSHRWRWHDAALRRRFRCQQTPH